MSDNAPGNPTGRPSVFTAELAVDICGRIVGGESVRSICRSDGMPAESTFYRWLADPERASFREDYARAKAAFAERWGEELLEIADDGSNDWMERRDGDDTIRVVDHEHIARSKLRVDTRKWLMSKLLPKKYGDKLGIEHSGGIQTMTDEAVESRIAQLLGKAGTGGTVGGTEPPGGAD